MSVRAWVHALRHRCAPAHFAAANPFVVVWLDPRLITHVTRERMRVEGRRVPGGWDLQMAALASTPLYRGLVQRFVDGRPWEETELRPDRFVPTWPDRDTKYATLTFEEFLRRGTELDRLHESLRAHGYLHPRISGEPIDRVMSVVIGRTGVLARNRGGLHRLLLSQIIGLDRVPARVVAVHTEFRGSESDVLLPDTSDPPQ
jgi:hypothetical protein